MIFPSIPPETNLFEPFTEASDKIGEFKVPET